ncbi:MAG: phosphoribosylglycinamide formyltransferase [Thermoanaerobaculia bacterium]|nr:phosphoribosylglycinamide formyltransferase [Thermoanaerobaculia bacterium]
MTARVAVMISGRGSNFLALHGAMERKEVPAEIALVVSNVAEAPGLAKARSLRLPTVCFPHRLESGRLAHERRVHAALEHAEIEWICLAGYMRLLSADFVSAYRQRILNIHPSLLPAFPGLEAQQQAIEWGVRVSGCTVHLVDEKLDHGPIVAQRTVPVRQDDNASSLSARILAEEHRAYPEALRRLLTERWRVVGRRVEFLPGGVDSEAGGAYTYGPGG